MDSMELEQDYMSEKLPIVTILLIAINVVVFVVTEWRGSSLDADYMIEAGAMYAPAFFGNHEYYRLITHFFMHFGMEHLFNNMVSLLVLGYALENVIGRIWFAILYMASGVLAGIVSVANMWHGEPETLVVSCGASGAVYGLMGALLVMLIAKRRHSLRREIPRFVLYLGLSLYSGMRDPGIDNMAHVGGFVSGILLCVVMYLMKRINLAGKEQVM